MRTRAGLGVLLAFAGMLALHASRAAPLAVPLHEASIRRMDLGTAMGLRGPWSVEAFQPADGGGDPGINTMPARICVMAPLYTASP